MTESLKAMKNYSISEILRTLMHYKNVRIVDLVNATSIPQPTLHRIATGKTTNPKPKYLKIIALKI